QCVLVFPASPLQAEVDGVASCRESAQSWDKPVAVALEGRHLPKETDLLVFVLSISTSTAMHNGDFDLKSAAPGPLVRVSSVVAPVEIGSDAVAYLRHNTQLKGSA